MAVNSQNIRVDGSSMANNGTISAIGYVDTCLNVDDSAESGVQDNGSSNRIGWRSINDETRPAVLRDANIALTGPQYVSAVPETIYIEEIKDDPNLVWDQSWPTQGEAAQDIPLLLWETNMGKQEALWTNLPIKMGDSDNWNYNSRYADNLKVIIRR